MKFKNSKTMRCGIAIILSLSIVMVGCSAPEEQEETSSEEIISEQIETVANINIEEIPAIEDAVYYAANDPELITYMEDAVYYDMVSDINSDEYYIQNIDAIYLSQEYIEELSYNSKENEYFGYKLSDVEAAFEGKSYYFTVNEEGQTVVEEYVYEESAFDKMIKDVAIGAGVILFCVTVSIVAAPAAPAVSMIFAVGAKTGTAFALSSGAISAVSAGAIAAYQTGDIDKALDEAMIAGGEGFKFGAILGCLSGGAAEGIGLYGATANGLTMNEAALIQKESKLPLNMIKNFQSMDQYNVIKDAGMTTQMVDGKLALVRSIDTNYVDEMGISNLERMQQGLAPIDPETGLAYELHHMGQTQDATLAILTQAEHRGAGNHAIWHDLISSSEVDHGAAWTAQREAFWKAFAARLV